MDWFQQQKIDELIEKIKAGVEVPQSMSALATEVPSLMSQIKELEATQRMLFNFQNQIVGSPEDRFWKDEAGTWHKITNVDGVFVVEDADPPKKFLNGLKNKITRLLKYDR